MTDQDDIKKLLVGQARIETSLGHIQKVLQGMDHLPAKEAEHEARIDSLEKTEQGRWKAVAAIGVAIVSGLSGVIMQLLR